MTDLFGWDHVGWTDNNFNKMGSEKPRTLIDRCLMTLTLGPFIVFEIATQRLLFYLFDSTGFWFTCISNESINAQGIGFYWPIR